jgi:predicted HD phosphohydrolase
MERLFRREHPAVEHGHSASAAKEADRFEVYRMLLGPLASVEQRKSSHPEGDALYHSLQVFELARNELPYDEEFLLAALLHDVGKALDPMHHVEAGLAALNGHITERTGWLIANHTDAHRLLNGTIGARAKRRLQLSEDYDELLRLARCDRNGRVPGGAAPDIEGALDYIRGVAQMCDE